ncbi:MAG: hypothetical protein FJ087_18125 [Deltaproteobacteria bacterium]|nr:hypothetical protein [Deltaproteobacteria bacterium]
MSIRVGRAAAAVAMFALVGAACGGAGGESKLSGVSKIEVAVEIATGQWSTKAVVTVDPGQVAVGETRDYKVRVRNTGEKGRPLCVTADPTIKAEYEAVDPELTEGPAFSPVAPAEGRCIAPTGEGDDLDLPESYTFTVRFKRYDDAQAREVVLTIPNDNSVETSLQSYRIRFETGSCEPSLDAPETVDLGPVHEPTPEELGINNGGSCPLEIRKFTFDGDPNFVLVANGKDYPIEETKGEVVFDPPIVVDPGKPAEPQWEIRYSPVTDDPAQARVIVYSNDRQFASGREIKIIANTSGPRLCVEPSPVEFGGKLLHKKACIDVQITSCGTGPLDISNITLGTGGTEFELDFKDMGGVPTANLDVNQSATFKVCYTPNDRNPVDPATNKVILDTNEIQVANNTFKGTLAIQTTGFGVEVECPQPVIVIEQGQEVPPQTLLNLYGDQSLPSTGTITQYNWSVNQPNDNKFNFVPSSTFPNPTHEVNIAGEYIYCLDVCDSARCSSDPACNTTDCETVLVLPTDAIHCELTWDTPGDMDQSDEGPDAGSDMDLHFTHPFATGPDLDGDGQPDPWFNLPYDVFWFNPKPDWESMNPNAKDDPRLDRDDTDGAGPENLNLDAPVDGRRYKVGVHYWDDHGYGFSYPHVRCYIWGQLVFDIDLEPLDQKLFKCDLWEVAEIVWPGGMVKKITNPDGSLKITHKYQNPGFVQIGGGSCTN